MIPAIRIDLPPETVALLTRAKGWPRALTTHLVRELDQQNQQTVEHTIEARMTGKGPFTPSAGKLGVITSRLRRSLRRTTAGVEGATITSAIGSNVRYAGAHEFGFSGTVTKKAHRARNLSLDVYSIADNLVKGWELIGAKGRSKAKRVASGYVLVKAHQVQLNIPARAPIQRGISDRLGLYSGALSGAIVRAFQSENPS